MSKGARANAEAFTVKQRSSTYEKMAICSCSKNRPRRLWLHRAQVEGSKDSAPPDLMNSALHGAGHTESGSCSAMRGSV